jgi:hypothetical protein
VGIAATWSAAELPPTASATRPPAAPAAEPESSLFPVVEPLRLTLQPGYESVYAPPEPRRPGEGVNEGGVHQHIAVRYMTDYVFRGIDWGEQVAAFTDPADTDPDREDAADGHEDSPNLQFDGRLEFDLGKAPHPYVGVFVNTYNADPESEFQEIRPFFGLEWTARPIVLSGGATSYIYPDRDDLNTYEAWARLALDDSYFLRTDDPVFSPYVFAAYDLDRYEGLYMEAGVEHEFEFDEWGVTLTARGSLAYVNRHDQFALTVDPQTGQAPPGTDTSGLHHYQFGLIGRYELNPVLNIPRRYGTWTLEGYVFYTDGIEDDLNATTQVWGGAGIGFRY